MAGGLGSALPGGLLSDLTEGLWLGGRAPPWGEATGLVEPQAWLPGAGKGAFTALLSPGSVGPRHGGDKWAVWLEPDPAWAVILVQPRPRP